MYVCICSGVTESDIHDVVSEGCHSLEHLQQTLGVCTACGRCGRSALEVLECAVGGRRAGGCHSGHSMPAGSA